VALGAWVLLAHAASIAIAGSGTPDERRRADRAGLAAMMTEHPDNADRAAGGGAGAHASGSVEGLRAAVHQAAEELLDGAAGGGPGRFTLERPPRAELGDYSTNAGLVLAPALGAAPRAISQRLGETLQARLGRSLVRFEVAGPGFLNLFLADSWLIGSLRAALEAGAAFGGGGVGVAERILVEFVSANPTGPMHVGHARNAAYGDSLARTLAFHGHEVEREFYVNDAGSQVAKLGASILAVARGEPIPGDGYHGDYVERLVEVVRDRSADPAEVGRAAVGVMIGEMQSSLGSFAVERFDSWAYESELHDGDPSPVAHTLAILEQQRRTYTSEGALWLRTSEFGDDKDRVLVRATGEHTYFASDIAYHQQKRERGFDRQLDVWGADHHGYVSRMKAAYQALGGDPDRLELLIMQLVHLVRGGERAQMSKRAGEFVTLDELVAEIGVDAARWYLLARSHDTAVDLDLDLAREQSSENPVYYVQYAHARIASILGKAPAARVHGAEAGVGIDADEELHPAERALIEQLLAFPAAVAEAADRRAPHRIATYALELAQGFTAFYRDCRVLGVEPGELEARRLALCVAARRTIARSLDLLGVSAPVEM
jgi:arginyl-tRNA synthetase